MLAKFILALFVTQSVLVVAHANENTKSTVKELAEVFVGEYNLESCTPHNPLAKENFEVEVTPSKLYGDKVLEINLDYEEVTRHIIDVTKVGKDVRKYTMPNDWGPEKRSQKVVLKPGYVGEERKGRQWKFGFLPQKGYKFTIEAELKGDVLKILSDRGQEYENLCVYKKVL